VGADALPGRGGGGDAGGGGGGLPGSVLVPAPGKFGAPVAEEVGW